MSQLLLITITLMSGFLVIYHHLGYPLILKLLTKKLNYQPMLSRSRGYASDDLDEQLPSIAIVMPAYNEAQWITEKIRNLAALDYPKQRLQIFIGCDGCTDQTYQLAQQTALEPECKHLNIQLFNFQHNRGKVQVINELILKADATLIALTDVSALLSIDALLIATERFKDPKVGVVNSHYQLVSPSSEGEQSYWDYQSKIKLAEASLGATLGAHGAFYMFRSTLFEPLAADTINDDFILPMKIVAAGYRADYDNEINALELEQVDTKQELQRRRRIAAGNFQQLLRLKVLLLPRYKGIAFAFLSGKALRVLMPFLMLLALFGSLILSPYHWLFICLAIVQLCAYSIALLQIIKRPKNSNKVSKLLAYLVSGHYAGLIGSLRYLLRLDKAHWTKTH